MFSVVWRCPAHPWRLLHNPKLDPQKSGQEVIVLSDRLSGSTLDVISVTSLLASRVPCWCYGELREETNT